MRKSTLILLSLLIGMSFGTAQTHWVTAYYAGWAKFNSTPVDIPQIDFTCATHWVFFTMSPTSGGTFDGTGSGIDAARMQQFVNAAHGAGRKAIIGTGGWGSDYTGCVTNVTTSVNFLTNLMKTYGFDGVDIDWEPVPSAQYTNYAAWVKALKTAMLAVNSQAVLMEAALGFDQALVNNMQYLDQINLMTYDMSGPWPGWLSWHNSAIYDGGNRFISTGALMPSIDASITSYTTAGVPPAKLGFGIEFYGYIWNGVTGPMQSTFGTVQNTVPYAQIMDTYAGYPLKWDVGAQAAYFSPPNQFVSFDADTTMGVKANYMKAKGLGGVIVYEVAAAYRNNLPAGFKDQLLQTVKHAFMGGAPPPSDSIPPVVKVTAPANNATLKSQVTVTATATDNSGVAGVQFQIDGKPVGNEQTAGPYTVSFNSWMYPNGAHTISAVGRDWSGNKGTGTISVTIANSGPPPTVPDKIVYDDALQTPFTNTSWNATVDFSNTSPVSVNSTRSAKVTYNAWGGFDMLSGTWSTEQMIDPNLYDSLRFDVYSPTAITITVGYYVGGSPTVSVSPNAWHTFSVPLPTVAFPRFYFQSGAGSTATVYFDNIKFHAIQIPTGTAGSPAAPKEFALEQNFPNPFNPTTTIRFSVPVAGHVSLIVYDLLGNEVATLVNEVRGAGTYNEVFDSGSGRGVKGSIASGVYFYRLAAGSYSETRRLILLK
jgi:chitinase